MEKLSFGEGHSVNKRKATIELIVQVILRSQLLILRRFEESMISFFVVICHKRNTFYCKIYSKIVL
ncbi:hypothetical protein [Niallia sp. 01092]|uniref:hypothetical protein n=1 Tax=unclassified Niallia TaxID=2837522 RepID=UPI003FD619F2